MDIKQKLLNAMRSATSQKPMDTESLYPLGKREEIEAALMELYQGHQIACCKIIKKSVERIVWWPVGGICELPKYGTGVPGMVKRNGRGAAA